MLKSYIVLDLEMTGLNAKYDKIIEIGALKIIDEKIIDKMQILINPHMSLSEAVTDLTGITDQMLQQGIEEKDAITRLIAFCTGFPLIGHNILLDYRFLKQSAVNHKLAFSSEGVDTLKLARKLQPALPSKSLGYLCSYFGILQTKEHRAFEDAEATYRLFLALEEKYRSGNEKLFEPEPILCKIKRQVPITDKQKKYLNELLQYHNLEAQFETDYLTRSEASRLTDLIMFQFGRMQKTAKKC